MASRPLPRLVILAALVVAGCRPTPPATEPQKNTGDVGRKPDPQPEEPKTPKVDPKPAPPKPPEVAPPPRPFFPPPPGYSSGWVRVGTVEVRVAGVAVTTPPITTADRRPSIAPNPVLVVWLEVRTESRARQIRLKRWQDALIEKCSLSGRKSGIITRAALGQGASLRSNHPYSQTLPPDGTPLLELVAFSVPTPEDGDLILSLDGEPVGETGTFNIPIPASAIKK